MKSSVTRMWYRIALARGSEEAALVAAQGEHLGAAIAAAERRGGGYAVAAEVATGGEVPLGESVGKHHIVELGSAGSIGGFRWPIGVLPQLGHTAAIAGAASGFVQHDDPNALVLEAQVAADQLVDVFLGLIERLPAADNLEVRLLDHFEAAGVTDVWLTSRVNGHKILRFLDDHDDELFGNGHLELSIYLRAQRATLRLTEHKTVVWIAEGGTLEAEICRWLDELGVPRRDRLIRISDVAHFHYRPAGSRNRAKLGEELYRQRLRCVATLRPDV